MAKPVRKRKKVTCYMKIQVAQRLGKLQKKGWKPRRTIILCNWDAEEYGLVIFFLLHFL